MGGTTNSFLQNQISLIMKANLLNLGLRIPAFLLSLVFIVVSPGLSLG